MPICTTCTTAVPFLYTVYESSYNLRLEQCTNCPDTFADPYVEHDSLTLLLDLILLKRGVYRHLLYNRGAEPRRAISGTAVAPPQTEKEKEKMRWLTILRFGGPILCVDAFIRWCHLNPSQPPDISPWTRETTNALLRTFVGVSVETIAFHFGVLCACHVVLGIADRLGSRHAMSDIRREFRFSLIPLTLFYSSLTKLFLLFLLTIWRPSSGSAPLPSTSYGFQLFGDDNREWVVRNVLGGMSAGFGLRVVLDSPPLFTTIIIISGWVVKTAASHLVSRWVGGDEQMGEAWLAYSIP
ncbi:Arv1-like family-domain-containing protein [Mycena alexandri]|uniref:Protein ARV n=1 Tax=Mycena alexandri TaxID=1745969 RepID=A0AAD6X2S2_9AGAR|nr:Arv1-like family-domain-containing protein [Mycena alexandri]